MRNGKCAEGGGLAAALRSDRGAAEGAEDLVLTGGTGVIMVAANVVGVATTFVEVGRSIAVMIKLGEDAETIEGVADHGRVVIGLGDLLGVASGGVIVVAGVGVDVAAAVVERRDGVGGEDGVKRGGWVEVYAIEGDADGAAGKARRAVLVDGINGNEVGGFVIMEPFGATLDDMVVIAGIDVGTGGGFEGFFGVGHANGAVFANEVPRGVGVEFGEVGDKRTVDIVDLAIFEPNAALFFGVGDVLRAPRAHGVFVRA